GYWPPPAIVMASASTG
ncbi:MAG: ABC transporter, partial [Dehalococcoidia bacterium]